MNDTTGTWVSCEHFGEPEKCTECGAMVDPLYYRQDKPGSTTGDYWCRECAEFTGQEIVDDKL